MKPRHRKFFTGHRPAVYAREGLVLGMRNPFDGPVFETRERAENWCIDVIMDHYERGFGLSDTTIYLFKGMVAGH